MKLAVQFNLQKDGTWSAEAPSVPGARVVGCSKKDVETKLLVVVMDALAA